MKNKKIEEDDNESGDEDDEEAPNDNTRQNFDSLFED